ncbi:MAG TPA: amino acid racemase [Stellaceae bacterium]|nr:amino acid racemase [Stellaceae bacterium]
MKRVGILGGSSDQATADYYRRLNQAANERLGGLNTAELLISSMNFAFCADCIRNDRWEALADYLCNRTQALERAGAEILICVSNTLHRLADRFTAGLRIPFIHIADPTGRAIRAAGLERVGLLGTLPAMTAPYLRNRYAERFGIEIMVPDEAERIEVDRIIFDELCKGRFEPGAKARYLEIIDDLHRRGVEGVILGCTEIPLLVSQPDRPNLPMFDTAGLHVAAAMAMALGDEEV